MRKHILLPILIILITIACHPKLHKTGNDPEQFNHLIYNAQSHPDLYGKSTEDGLKQPPFNTWYVPNYNAYTPDSLILAKLRPELRNKTIQIFMGTWCGDSRREVPRMLKVLNICGFPPLRVEIINVGHGENDYKQSPTHEERGKNIHHVPTFIIYEKGKEINRIIETPIESLERDLLRIVNREAYTPKYAGAAMMLEKAERYARQ
ncbi:MAG: thioredoxin family protein [Chitinophagaceae bacterium]|nr:thioredoxin family protein [Chitinophagaceae bacterium]